MTHEGASMSIGETSVLGKAAIGTIGPELRIKAGEITAVGVEDLTRRLATDEFYGDIGELGPNAAGGTFSLVVADALTTNRFRQPGQTAAEHARGMFSWLVETKNDDASRRIIPRVCVDGRTPTPESLENTSVVGGHDNCGAIGHCSDIFEYIATNGDTLREHTAALGIETDDDTHGLITSSARARLEEGYVSPAPEIRKAFIEAAGESSVAQLAGGHVEVTAGVNFDKDLSLDRRKIDAVMGAAYDAFCVDAGVFPDAAAVISLTETEVHQKTIALLYHNLATTYVLSDKSLQLAEHH